VIERVVPSAALIAAESTPDLTWSQFLQARVVKDWRPGEFDFQRLLYVPNPDDPHARLHRCRRAHCGVLLNRPQLCRLCDQEWKRAKAAGAVFDEWVKIPRVRATRNLETRCLVPGCARSRAALGVCLSHLTAYRCNRDKHDDGYTIAAWIHDRAPKPLGAIPQCLVSDCWRDRHCVTGLCALHDRRFKAWRARERRPADNESVAIWMARGPEPFMDPQTRQTYASLAATPFGLLPEPLRWEFLYAVQQRDLHNAAKIAPIEIRSTYASMRRKGWSTVVGLMDMARVVPGNKALTGLLGEWRRIIDDAHREWSGVDDRDPKILYASDLNLPHGVRLGPNTRMNLTGIEQQWIFDSVSAWARAGQRAVNDLYSAASAWTLVDEVLRGRTPRHRLGVTDMDAITRAIRQRWRNAQTQGRALLAIRRVISWARQQESLRHYWDDVPVGFAIDPARHRPDGEKTRTAGDADEPFRFVPQPIIDWVMDHLHLIDRGDPYLTAEARAMIFVHERCGRRTIETTHLADDCVSYDNQGAPYLEWRRGKPPYTMGKRLPIHQETHDLIRQWQQIKREHCINSRWLFPSLTRRRHDLPVSKQALSRRVHQLIDAVVAQAPFPGPIEGADGNLVHFDLNTIDPYAFRHAFAQRLADATDAEGRSSTPPDVLQDYMGHKNFNTTMAYYEVTAKRRKKALAGLAPRRLNLHGKAVPVDRERDGFTKIAVSLGHCSEPGNVAAGGHSCLLEHACESCPFFLVDPFERDGMEAKRQHLMVTLERARVIQSPQHMLDHYEARIKDCTKIIDGIDTYVDRLPDDERVHMQEALDRMADIRRRATAPRHIDLRCLLTEEVLLDGHI
jgi:integrase